MFDSSMVTGLANADFMRLNECFSPVLRSYNKGEIVTDFSYKSDTIGIIKSGTAYLITNTSDDQRRILEYYTEGDFFKREIEYKNESIYMYIAAKTRCEIDFIDGKKLIALCEKQCSGHLALLEKMIKTSSKKSLAHLNILSRRSIRDKLIIFFSYLSSEAESLSFELPLPLSDLADYIGADRSAMMRELKNMKADRLIETDKRRITLLREI